MASVILNISKVIYTQLNDQTVLFQTNQLIPLIEMIQSSLSKEYFMKPGCSPIN